MTPTDGDIGHFDRIARFYDSFSPESDSDVLREGLEQAERPIERIADVAGGTGRAVRALDVNEEVVVDASAGMLAQAHSHGLACVRGDATRLPLASESVDAAVISDALHHIGDPDATLAEVERILRPGGVLIVREYNPATVRGWFLVRGEHLLGMDSTFVTPEALVRKLDAANLVPRVRNRGFDYTVAGVKPTPGTP
ncbi:methyl transferase-like protein [Haladaptatus paucihalophilus DX253]|uniref:Demethylmenaquinone methyltransferase / 2-methoxy-6-polyprenyl-1,4-benzoquinol methylase n=1 Tax=Haladaptatus paucihalophilus DX253 TaxID=797209 RepID=E7QRT8_HALPU|nr:methyltransferase domain-containing protein [Haladaptatus paucihalophilus]EFW92707.1 methyl transferase-like protein [Haladaptatus paucihalophilus DX253]SHK15065.1 demethylmenaquinone methyltransferase / 2-methoxy-6-polyprenyl-1,4-benzoquinol methylase [Haladaptatus paucihalophilus DX253]